MAEKQTQRLTANVTIQAPGHREFADGIYLIKECIARAPIEDPSQEWLMDDWYEPGRENHGTQTAYFVDDDETLLYDTLTPASTELILNELDSLLDGRELDYLVISHPEANHAGNAHAILDEYPEATLIVPGRGAHHDLHGMEGLGDEVVRKVADGDTLELGDHTIEFVEEVFFDHAMTIWMFEQETETLFTSDFMGFSHMDGECLSCVDELDDKHPTKDQLARFNGFAFTWFRFVDTEETDRALDRIAQTYNPSNIAPAHGQVARENIPEYLETMKEVIQDIAEYESDEYRVHAHQMLRYTSNTSDIRQ